MIEADVISEAVRGGFELEERPLGDAWVWGWSRGDDTRWPCYLTRGEALRWMVDRLQRVRVFA